MDLLGLSDVGEMSRGTLDARYNAGQVVVASLREM